MCLFSYYDAIVGTIYWRNSMSINRIDTSSLRDLVKDNVAYTSSALDKDGRPIIYLKIGKPIRQDSNDNYLKLLMYTVERYQKNILKILSIVT